MPSSTAAISDAKFVSLTTYKKDGTPKPLPVWIAALPDGRVGFTTSGESWKAKRVRTNPQVTLRPCDQRGRVADGAAEVTGTAVVVSGTEFAEVEALIKAKYGFMFTVMKTVNSMRGVFKKQEAQSSSAMIITPD